VIMAATFMSWIFHSYLKKKKAKVNLLMTILLYFSSYILTWKI
jgi:hypothetical protein